MQYRAFSASVFFAALVLTYGEGRGKPLRLSMARIKQAQSTGEILKAAEERENIIQRQLKIATEVDSSNALRERQLRHQEDSAGHAAQVISDMQQIMTEERALRMAAQAHASQIQQTLKSATDDEVHMSSELEEVQEDLSQREQQLANETTALARAHLDKESLDQKFDALKSADAQKTIIIKKDVNLIIAKTREEKTNIGLLQQKLDAKKVVEERHEKMEKEDKAHIDYLTSERDSLLVNTDDLKAQISTQAQAAKKSDITADIERKLAQQTKQALAEANLRIAPLEEAEKKLAALRVANKKLHAAYETQVAASAHGRGLEHQEEKILESTQDSLKEANLKLVRETEAKKQEHFELKQMFLEMQQQQTESQSQAAKLASLRDSLGDAEAESSAMKKKVDDTAVVAHRLNDEGRKLHAKIIVLKKSNKAQNLKLKAMHSQMIEQVEADNQKEVLERAAAEKSEEVLKKEAALAHAQLDAASQARMEIIADAENLEREAKAKSLKLQAAVMQAKEEAAAEESRLNSVVADKTTQINALQMGADKQIVMLKEALEEKAKLDSTSDSRAKDLAAKTKELQASRLRDDQLAQKLKKVSTALVKEHKQRLEDWTVFKTKLENDA